MIDELVLERLFAETAEEIPLPELGMTRVIDELERSLQRPPRTVPRSARFVVAAAAVLVVVVGLGALLTSGSHGSNESSEKSASSPVADSAGTPAASPTRSAPGVTAHGALPGRFEGAPSNGAGDGSSGSTSETSPSSGPAVPVDGAKIVKTGTLDLQVAHDTLRTAVSRVSGVATGLGGYVSNSTTSYDDSDPTASIAIRVPVNTFDAAIAQLKGLPGVKDLGDSETGKDVTAQYTNLQAQLTAAQAEESSLLDVLSHAESIGDILAVRDRITGVQSEINQLQGQINLLGNQASLSSIAITMAEKTVTPAAHLATPPTGISKSWQDARQGFTNSIEWIIARSGGALIVFLAILALLFGLRYLYPAVRHALL